MGTSYTRERLARQVTGAVLDGGEPAAEAAGFNTAVVAPAPNVFGGELATAAAVPAGAR